MYLSSLLECLGYRSPELIFYLFKTGNTLLDSTIRPFINTAVCREVFSDNPHQCSEVFINDHNDVIEQRTAAYLTYYRVLLYVPSCFLGVFWGAWCDREGCKLPMMLPNVGCVLGIVPYILIWYFPENTLLLLLLGTAAQGFMSAASIVKMSVSAYIAKSCHERLDRRLAVLLGMNSLGLFSGYLLVGILLQMTNALVSFCVASSLHTLAMLLMVTFIEDQELRDRGYPGSSLKVLLSGLIETMTCVFKKREGNARCIVLLLCVCVFLQGMIIVGYADIPLLYVLGKPLLWSKSTYGYYLAAEQAVRVFGLFVIQPLISSKLLLSETSIITLCLFMGIVRTVWKGLSVYSWMMWSSLTLAFWSSMITPYLRVLLKKHTSVEEIGKIYSFAESLDVIARPIASTIFIATYSATYDFFPGTAYFVHSLLHAVAFVLMICIRIKS